MANRVTGAEVKEIIDTTLTADEITPFIDTANAIVTDVVAVAINPATGAVMTEAQLTNVELYLSAHFVTLFDPRKTSEKLGDASSSYQLTSYGKMAMMFDYTGALTSLGKPLPSILGFG